MCLHLYSLTCKPLYLCLGASTFTHVCMSWCSPTYATIFMSLGAWGCLPKSVFMRMSVFGSLCGWMRLCVAVGVLLLCALEDSICWGICLPVCTPVSVPVLVRACLCSTYTHLCLQAYIWRYTQVLVQVCVCAGVLAPPVWAHTFLHLRAQVHRHPCFCVSLCALHTLSFFFIGCRCCALVYFTFFFFVRDDRNVVYWSWWWLYKLDTYVKSQTIHVEGQILLDINYVTEANFLKLQKKSTFMS